ncbi:MAG: efflux RND transporter periplasmic adaptor subunit [Hellea sp.]|nr:efflux RND transporter periplasmic adaptor subunit [Hellea sp.]
MKPNRSQIIALVAILLIGGWFALNSGKNKNGTLDPNKSISQTDKLPSVVTRLIDSQPHSVNVKLFGRTEPSREVMIKAETPGLIAATPISEGSVVQRGTVVCRQDINARQASVDQAKALLKTRQAELAAAQKLVERGFASQTQLLTAQAAMDAASASVKQAEIELDNVNLRAPFTGIYDKNMAEVGDYLNPGQPCGLLIELDPLIVTIELTESQLALIKPDQDAIIALATGQTVAGKVKFIESRANPATRTFRTEILVPNPEMILKAGVTATVNLTGEPVNAQLVPGQILALDENGTVGVKYLDRGDIVRFAITETIDDTDDGIWVRGLPDSVRIIIKGQDYVAIGIQANGIDEYDQ